MHKSEGRKKPTSWLCSLLETPAEFIKGLSSKNMPVTPRRSYEVSEHLPSALWFLKADAASGMWGDLWGSWDSSRTFKFLPVTIGGVRAGCTFAVRGHFQLRGDRISASVFYIRRTFPNRFQTFAQQGSPMTRNAWTPDSGISPLSFKRFSQSPLKFWALEWITNKLIFAELPVFQGDQ